jgi:lipid-A-disaccharide synthase-like uncharacterized protein
MDTGGSSLGVKRGWGMMLTIHPHLVLRSRMSKSYISSPSWHLRGIAGQLYFTLLYCAEFLEIKTSSKSSISLVSSISV